MIRFIYKTTNNINGKIYIGQHSTECLDDGYLGSGVILKKAFKNYGKENFSREIITYVDTKEDLDRYEEIYIKHYMHIVGKSEMYNVAENAAGGFNKGRQFTDEHRQKMSAALKGHPVSEEARKKISEANKGQNKGRPTWNKGISPSDETRQKMSTALKGHQFTDEARQKISVAQKNRPDHSKPVLCIENCKIYQSTKEAERQTGIDQSSISKVCRGKQKIAGGFHWKFA